MNMQLKGWILLAGMVLLVLMSGCSGKHKLVSGAPDWVNRGSGAFKDGESRQFYGVGVVTGVPSRTLARQTADQRARADIARQFDTFVSNLFRDYLASTNTNMGDKTVEEQHVEQTIKNLTNVSVRGARVIEYWKEPDSDTIYALARLDLEGVKATLEQMERMDERMKGYVRDNAARAFDRLNQEGR